MKKYDPERIIGPILFILYINDIQHIENECKIYLYADDTSIFVTAKNYNELKKQANEILNKVHIWLCTNRLSLNLEKTHFLLFSKRKQVFLWN